MAAFCRSCCLLTMLRYDAPQRGTQPEQGGKRDREDRDGDAADRESKRRREDGGERSHRHGSRELDLRGGPRDSTRAERGGGGRQREDGDHRRSRDGGYHRRDADGDRHRDGKRRREAGDVGPERGGREYGDRGAAADDRGGGVDHRGPPRPSSRNGNGRPPPDRLRDRLTLPEGMHTPGHQCE